jgi:hypothetical protein
MTLTIPFTFECERCGKNDAVENHNCKQIQIGKKVYGPYCADCAKHIVDGSFSNVQEWELNYTKS